MPLSSRSRAASGCCAAMLQRACRVRPGWRGARRVGAAGNPVRRVVLVLFGAADGLGRSSWESGCLRLCRSAHSLRCGDIAAGMFQPRLARLRAVSATVQTWGELANACVSTTGVAVGSFSRNASCMLGRGPGGGPTTVQRLRRSVYAHAFRRPEQGSLCPLHHRGHCCRHRTDRGATTLCSMPARAHVLRALLWHSALPPPPLPRSLLLCVRMLAQFCYLTAPCMRVLGKPGWSV